MVLNEDRGHVVYCSRCGAEMFSNSRYCMKCGNLNYDHQENENMREFQPPEEGEIEGKYLFNVNLKAEKICSGDKTGNPKIPFLIFLLVYLLIVVLTGASFWLKTGDFLSFASSPFYLVTILGAIFSIYIYSFCLLFMKCNKPWWAALIPIYNYFVLTDIAFGKSFLGVLFLIPGVNVIFFFILCYQLGLQFQYNGLLTALFSFIMLPVIGFSSRPYMKCPIADEGIHSAEKAYKRKRTFLSTMFLFIIIGIGMFVYANFNNGSNLSSYVNYYYVYTDNKLVNYVKKGIDEKVVSCSRVPFSKTQGVYYFYYDDVGYDIPLFLYIMRDPISAYVKVDNSGVEPKYYVSMSDGKNGFKETLYEDVSMEVVKKFPELNFEENMVNSCTFD